MIIFLGMCAGALLIYGLTGVIHTEAPKYVRNMSFVYFAISATAQLLATQFLILSLIICALSLSAFAPSKVTAVMSGLAALTYAVNLWQSYRCIKVYEAILPSGSDDLSGSFWGGALRPLKFHNGQVQHDKNISYGPHGARNSLDIYRPKNLPGAPMPILIHIHGGAWTVGQKDQQAKPLIGYLAQRGWMVVDINYRLGPKFRFPDIITDVLRAVHWVRGNAADYGGDPDFIALTGGSAGGHLTALAALAHDNPAFKQGFEEADCHVNAAIPVYGVYDFTDRTQQMQRDLPELQAFMTKYAMPGGPEANPELWDMISPVAQVRSDAPPMFMIHGRHDSLANFKGAEIFVNALKAVSDNPVYFAALPSGQHAFDSLGGPPTQSHIRAIERFLTNVRPELKR